MESKPIEIVLSAAEMLEVVNHTLRDKTKDLEEVERKIRELKREDAEQDFLYTFVDSQYINPENKSNAEEIAPLEQERELLVYIITCTENKLAEIQGGGAPAASSKQAPPQQQQGGAGMWK